MLSGLSWEPHQTRWFRWSRMIWTMIQHRMSTRAGHFHLHFPPQSSIIIPDETVFTPAERRWQAAEPPLLPPAETNRALRAVWQMRSVSETLQTVPLCFFPFIARHLVMVKRPCYILRSAVTLFKLDLKETNKTALSLPVHIYIPCHCIYHLRNCEMWSPFWHISHLQKKFNSTNC